METPGGEVKTFNFNGGNCVELNVFTEPALIDGSKLHVQNKFQKQFFEKINAACLWMTEIVISMSVLVPASLYLFESHGRTTLAIALAVLSASLTFGYIRFAKYEKKMRAISNTWKSMFKEYVRDRALDLTKYAVKQSQ